MKTWSCLPGALPVVHQWETSRGGGKGPKRTQRDLPRAVPVASPSVSCKRFRKRGSFAERHLHPGTLPIRPDSGQASGHAQERKWRCADTDPDDLVRRNAEDRSLDLLDLVSGFLAGGRDVGADRGSGHGPPLREMAVETARVFRGVASRLSEGLSGPVRSRSLSSYTAETLASGSVPSLRIAR